MNKEEALKKFQKGESFKEDLEKEVLDEIEKIKMATKPEAKVSEHKGHIYNSLAVCIKALQDQGGKDDKVIEMKKRVHKARQRYSQALEIMSDYCTLI